MRRRYRRRLKRKRVSSGKSLKVIGVVVLLALIIGAGLFVGVKGIRIVKNKISGTVSSALGDSSIQVDDEATLAEAEKLAAMYDYDGAIEKLKELPEYTSSSKLQDLADEYREKKEACVSYPLDQVTHVFFHTLIKDTSKAFDGDYKEGDYNQVMTTIDEFNKIIESMYEKGYVLVSLRDMAEMEEDENGNMVMTKKEIMLPEGKKAFVLSQDDVSYYEYMEGDGFATRLLITDDGKIKNEYKNDDGTTSIGDYDVLPLLDSFVEEHPDFSYHGAKGILALTGYNGVLGYRTDPDYESTPEKTYYGDYDEDVAMAKKVAQAIRDDGWEFASHSYGHRDLGTISWEAFKTDTDKWEATVEPIIGETDIMIYPFGAEIGDWHEYSGERYEYLKSVGFNYFCNVDSNQYWVQITDNYLRQGRRNLDGYRMYYNPEKLEDLFDAKEVFDSSRPTPVPPMSN